MKAVIVLGGNPPDASQLRAQCGADTLLLCADSGAQAALDAGLRPDWAVGDFDSIAQETRFRLIDLGVRLESLPPDKDMTDGEVTLELALRLGVEDVLFLGLAGGRMDHFLGNLAVLLRAARRGLRTSAAWAGAHAWVCAAQGTCEAQLRIHGEAGQTLSLLPLGGDAWIVETRNLRWPLIGQRLYADATRGVSNLFEAAEASVTVGEGAVLAVRIDAGIS